jgi:hypothetical protein
MGSKSDHCIIRVSWVHELVEGKAREMRVLHRKGGAARAKE